MVEFAGAAAPVAKDGASGVVMPSAGVLPLARALRALVPLGLSALTVSGNLSASHLSQAALEELASQTTALFSQRDADAEVFPKRAAFNVLPAVGPVGEDGIAQEERFLAEQLPKLLGLPELPVFAACAYVPAFFGSTWAITAEFAGEVGAEQALAAFERAGIECNAQTGSDMVTPMDVAGSTRLVVERLRSQRSRLSFWLVADSVRVNAAGWAELLQGMVEKG
jgi:aspartate-semialdehyde dehydrogenase